MMRVQITDDQRGELAQVSRQAVGRVALRAQMVLLAARGYSVPRIAEVHDCGQDVVRLWLHRYSEEGVHGLEDTPSASPRPPRRPPERASGGNRGTRGMGVCQRWERRHLSSNNLSRLAAELHPPSRAVASRLKPMPTKESDNDLCTTGSRQPPSHPRSSRSTGTNSGFGR